MKKVFFFDIDDTLLLKGVGISNENIKAIKKLKESYDVYIATGKSITMAQPIFDILEVKNSITSNGSVVVEDGEMIYSKNIVEEDIKKIQTLIEHMPGTIVGGQGNGDSYVIGVNKDMYDNCVTPIFEELSVAVPKGVDEFKENIYQLWLLGEVEGINYVGEEFDTFRWHQNGLDIVYKNTSKAQAIQYLLDTKYKGQDIMTYAFGDSLNDVSMFELVDVGVAVSNAKDELKKVATDITDNSENKGVFNYLVENNFI